MAIGLVMGFAQSRRIAYKWRQTTCAQDAPQNLCHAMSTCMKGPTRNTWWRDVVVDSAFESDRLPRWFNPPAHRASVKDCNLVVRNAEPQKSEEWKKGGSSPSQKLKSTIGGRTNLRGPRRFCRSQLYRSGRSAVSRDPFSNRGPNYGQIITLAGRCHQYFCLDQSAPSESVTPVLARQCILFTATVGWEA